jgi:hypothetical protein
VFEAETGDAMQLIKRGYVKEAIIAKESDDPGDDAVEE